MHAAQRLRVRRHGCNRSVFLVSVLKREGRRGCATQQRAALLYSRVSSVSHKWSCKDATLNRQHLRLQQNACLELSVCLCMHIAVYMLYGYIFIWAIKPILCSFIYYQQDVSSTWERRFDWRNKSLYLNCRLKDLVASGQWGSFRRVWIVRHKYAPKKIGLPSYIKRIHEKGKTVYKEISTMWLAKLSHTFNFPGKKKSPCNVYTVKENLPFIPTCWTTTYSIYQVLRKQQLTGENQTKISHSAVSLSSPNRRWPLPGERGSFRGSGGWVPSGGRATASGSSSHYSWTRLSSFCALSNAVKKQVMM